MLDLLWLLLPVAAASGWYAANRSDGAKPSFNTGPNLRSDYFKGLSYLVNEQPDKAIEVFIRLLEVDKDTIETHLALGGLFRRRGEVDRAIRIHQNLLSRDGLSEEQRGQALLELGQDYMRAGLLDRAEGLFKELVDSEPFSDHALRELTDIYQCEKDWSNAIGAARQRAQVNGRSYGRVIAYYYCEQAEQLDEDGDRDGALDFVKRALDVSSQCVRASLVEGRMLAQAGDHRAAIRAYKRVEQQDHFYLPEIIAPLMACHIAIGRPNEMVDYLVYIMERYEGVSATLALADITEDREGAKAAVDFLTEQLRVRPSVKGLHRLIGMSLDHVDGPSRRYLLILRDLTDKLLENQPIYECHQCGFKVKTLHWQCPSCKYWGTIKPIQGVHGE